MRETAPEGVYIPRMRQLYDEVVRQKLIEEFGYKNVMQVPSITKIVLNNGKSITVRKPGFFAFREKGLLNSVRSDACSYFTTVLGPGYNREHADHFHFDLMQRRSGHRACK